MTTVTLSLNYHKAQKNSRTISFPAIKWEKICYVGFFMILVLLIFYVWQINDLTRGFYSVNTYGKQISKLSEENKNLEISFAESSFLGQALEKIRALNFQKTTSVKYIQIPDSSVALGVRKTK